MIQQDLESCCLYSLYTLSALLRIKQMLHIKCMIMWPVSLGLVYMPFLSKRSPNASREPGGRSSASEDTGVTDLTTATTCGVHTQMNHVPFWLAIVATPELVQARDRGEYQLPRPLHPGEYSGSVRTAKEALNRLCLLL